MVSMLVHSTNKMWTDGGAGAKICRALMKCVYKCTLCGDVLDTDRGEADRLGVLSAAAPMRCGL